MNQWADTARPARGRGPDRAHAARASASRLGPPAAAPRTGRPPPTRGSTGSPPMRSSASRGRRRRRASWSWRHSPPFGAAAVRRRTVGTSHKGVTMPFEFPVISADSHITEPPDCYTAHIDPAFRDQAPHMVTDEKRGDLFIVPGMKNPIAIGLVAAAGKAAEELTESGVLFGDIHRSGWDATARVADQVRDGVSAEVIYPTIGMMICNHPDVDFKRACFQAYNRWITEYCSEDPS